MAVGALYGWIHHAEAEREQVAQAKWEGDRRAMEAVESEAHHKNLDWYEAKLSKYGGTCSPTPSGRSPRQDMDVYGQGSYDLVKAERQRDDYVLIYQLIGSVGDITYVSSLALCQNMVRSDAQ